MSRAEVELEVVDQQQIEVERPRPVPLTRQHPALLHLDRLTQVEQLLGLQPGANPNHGVQEVPLIEDLPDRLGLVHGGDRLDLHAMLTKGGDRSAQVSAPIADVGAEPEVGGGAHSSSSSGSSGEERSWTTSTATSSTDSGRGGSGFAARTRTDSHAYRSISRSPIT